MRKILLWGLLGFLPLVPAGIGARAVPSLEDAAPQRSLQGQLLVAEPRLDDPNFDHTVVVMLEHDGDGAVGVVINRPYGKAPTAELLQRLGVGVEGVGGETTLFYGGPVQPEAGLVVHSADYALADTRALGSGLAVTSNPEILKDIATGKGPRQAVPVLGYAGWGPGQLESEIQANGWLTAPADPSIIFEGDLDTRYLRALAAMGIDPALLSTESGHA
jgi:putative transcriptional regulator